MFKERIQATQFSQETANDFFYQKIFGSSYDNDVSFLSSLRALLGERIPDDESVELAFNASWYSEDDLRGTSVPRAIGAIFNRARANTPHRITIHSFSSTRDVANKAWIEAVRKEFESTYDGWKMNDKVTLYFKKKVDTACFINPEKKSVVIFVDNMTLRTMHYIQAGIPAFVPWYFDQESGITQDELNLLESLRKTTPDDYMKCIDKIASKYDFRAARIKQHLNGFETRYERMQCNVLRNSIEETVANINSFNERIGNLLRQKRDFEAQLLGMELKVEEGGEDSEIMDYFLCNKKLSLQNVNDTVMEFVAQEYLTYYDEEMAKRIIENPHSYVYARAGAGNNISREDMKMLMTAIFIDQKLRIKFCAAYRFVLDGSVSARSGYRFGPEFGDYMPNPHIDKFSCLGSYSNPINRYLRDRNYIGALEQALASCKSLNFGDSPVMGEFMNQMYGYYSSGSVRKNTKCIELPDGRVVTPKDAIAYLKEESRNG